MSISVYISCNIVCLLLGGKKDVYMSISVYISCNIVCLLLGGERMYT